MTATETQIQPEAWRWETPPPYRADAHARMLEVNDRGTGEICDPLDPFRYEQDEQYRLELARYFLRHEKIRRFRDAFDKTEFPCGALHQLEKRDPQRWAEVVDAVPAQFGRVSESDGETYFFDAAESAGWRLEDAVNRARRTYDWVYRGVVEAEQRGLSLTELECERLFRGRVPVQLDNGAFVAFKESAAKTTTAPGGAARRFGQELGRALLRLSGLVHR